MAEIRIVGLTKRYGQTTALSGIDLTVADGEMMAVLGPSGCGKTTLLQLLAGFLDPDAGEIWADARLISSPRETVPPERRHMSLVFQSYALWPHMTCYQNVAFGLELRRLPRDEVKQRVTRMLDLVGLSGYEARYPSELSGGQQQRIALARALVVEPDTLLLDEPLSNLDANLREYMRFEIRRIHDETGITMIYVTHDQTEAMVIADRIAVVNAGRVEQMGAPHEIYEHPRSHFVAAFIGQANCLPGTAAEPGVVHCGELRFQVVEHPEIAPGEPVVLAIRPYAVQVLPPGADGARVPNSVQGTIVQAAYVGDARDLRVDLPGGLQVRTVVPAHLTYQLGQAVVLQFPPEACRVVRA